MSEPTREQAWQELAEKGRFTKPYVPWGQGRKQSIVFQVVNRPSFNPQSCLTLLADFTEYRHNGVIVNPTALALSWDGAYDGFLHQYGSRHTEPTFLIRRVSLGNSIDSLLEQGAQMAVPLLGFISESVPDGRQTIMHVVGRDWFYNTYRWGDYTKGRAIPFVEWVNQIEKACYPLPRDQPLEDSRTHAAAILQSRITSEAQYVEADVRMQF